jgi:DNA-binding XRE family transcriptional regulator
MAVSGDIEQMVRTRLRALRTAAGFSLDELAARTNLSASTISRIETGKRSIGLDVLVPLAAALHADLNALLEADGDEDVVIRPTPSSCRDRTTWMLSRPSSSTVAIKMRLEPVQHPLQQKVHPGHDWLFVLHGRIRLLLGEREILVETGEAAEFATMTPHAVAAVDGPAEIVMIFDRAGEIAHVHREGRAGDEAAATEADAAEDASA